MSRALALLLVLGQQPHQTVINDGTVRGGAQVKHGALVVSPPTSGMSAFGQTLTSEEYPEVFASFAYFVNSELFDTNGDGGGQVLSSPPFAVVSADGGHVTLESHRQVRYQPGQGITARFTAVWESCKAGSSTMVGPGTDLNGYFFGCCPSCEADGGAAFGVLRRAAGVETWVPQSSWNRDKRPDLDITKGSPYQIVYQWLGFGNVFFSVLSPTSGQFNLVHVVEYANTSTTTSAERPTLPAHIEANGNLKVSVPSMSLIRQGPQSEGMTVRRSFNHNKAAAVAAPVPLFSLRSRATFHSIENRVPVRLETLSIANAGSVAQTVVVRVTIDPELTGASYSDVNTNQSTLESSTAQTVTTNGRNVLTFVMEGGDTDVIDLSRYDVHLYAGDVVGISAQSISGTPTVTAALAWREEF